MYRGRMGRLLPAVLGVQALAFAFLYYNGAIPYQGYFSRQLNTMMDVPLGQYLRFDVSAAVVIEQRKDHIRHVCNNLSHTNYWSQLKPSGKVWSVQGVNYCITPKAGCTFWKRGFRYIGIVHSKPGSTKVKKLSDINRMMVHYGKRIGITEHGFNEHGAFSSNNSFMFSRNPYERLWSAYIDKFLLPDYWLTSAVRIAQYSRPKSEIEGEACFNDITFEEFMSSIAFGKLMNEHWEPVHRICSPCHVAFDVIGKMETFDADTKYIIDKYGLQEMQEENTKEERIRNELDMLIKYNFGFYESWYRSHDCYKLLDVANRLWFAFQLNGYIHKHVKLPTSELLKRGFHGNPERVLSTFVAIARVQHTEGMKTELKTQKRSMMLTAYKTLPRQTMDALRGIYKYDFLLFGYDDKLDID